MFKDTVPHKRIYLQTYVVGYLTPSLGSINPCLKCWVNTTFTDAVYRWNCVTEGRVLDAYCYTVTVYYPNTSVSNGRTI